MSENRQMRSVLTHVGAYIALLAASGAAQAARAPHSFGLDPVSSTYTPLPRSDVLITGATILDGAGARIDNGDVLVHEGKIVEVGRNLRRDTSLQVIDAKGRWVTPGIIDVHTHYGERGFPRNLPSSDDINESGNSNPSDMSIENAMDVQSINFSAALRAGVTTLQVLPGSIGLFDGRSVILKTITRNTVQEMKFPGAQQGFKMACGDYAKMSAQLRGAPNSRAGLVADLRTTFLNAKAYKEGWARYDAGKTDTPPAVDLKLDTLVALMNGTMDVHLHCLRADDMGIMANGLKEFGVHIAAFHHATEAYKITNLLRTSNICVAVWSDWWGFNQESLDAIRENAAFVDAGGGCAIIHSDYDEVGQHLNTEVAKAAAAGRHAGLDIPPEKAIRWITSNAAKALHLDDRIGTLAKGFNADIVLWSADPMSIYARPDMVFVDGAVAYDRFDPARQPRTDSEIGYSVLRDTMQ